MNGEAGESPWSAAPSQLKSGLAKAESVEVAPRDSWRVKYLGTLLSQRMEWHYLGHEDKVDEVQKLIDSLCIN